MNPRNTYTSSISALTGQPSALNTKKKVVFGMPNTNSGIPSPTVGTTANSTSAYPKGVNSPNPNAGNIVTSAPGATGTMQGSNAPATTTTTRTSTLPPAGQDYASKLASIQQGANNVQTAFDSYKAGQTKTTPEPEKKDSEYLKYLRGIFNPEEAKRAQENVNALNKQTADEIARSRKEQERIEKNEAGMIERGQTHLRTEEGRASAKALADLVIAKGYSTDILNQYLDAGKSVYDAEEAMRKEAESPLTLEESKALGLPFGTTMAEARQMGITPSSDSDNLNEATVFAYADMIGRGDMKIENVPESYRGAVAQAVGINGPQNNMSPYQAERITRNLNSLEDLMGQVSGWNTGMGSLIAAIPGTPAANFRADVNTLAANIAFGELTAMREASKTGGALGAVSERELALLESALGSLDRAQSPEQFRESLKTIKESIERWQAAVTGAGGGGATGGDEGLFDW
jgi:hypothetical protein